MCNDAGAILRVELTFNNAPSLALTSTKLNKKRPCSQGRRFSPMDLCSLLSSFPSNMVSTTGFIEEVCNISEVRRRSNSHFAHEICQNRSTALIVLMIRSRFR